MFGVFSVFILVNMRFVLMGMNMVMLMVMVMSVVMAVSRMVVVL